MSFCFYCKKGDEANNLDYECYAHKNCRTIMERCEHHWVVNSSFGHGTSEFTIYWDCNLCGAYKKGWYEVIKEDIQ